MVKYSKSLKKIYSTLLTIAVAVLFVGGISTLQAAFTYPSVNPPSSNVSAPLNTSNVFQDKNGVITVDTIGVTDGITLNGVTRTAAEGWPVSDAMATCHLETRRVDSNTNRFYTVNRGQYPNVTEKINTGQYPKCDDYLTPEARRDGWTHTGGDECTNVFSSDCQAGPSIPASCVYTRIVCTGGLSIKAPTVSTTTFSSYPFDVKAVQCVDGIDNDVVFQKIADPSGGLPSGAGIGVSFSPDGLYLAVTHTLTPFISIYKRASVSSDVFTKIANPTGGLPASEGNAVTFSPDGLYLVVGHAITPFVTIYKRPSTSSDAFAKIANPTGGLPAGNVWGVSFSPDGLYLATAHGTSPFVTIYKRPSVSSDAFAKIANPTGGLPAGAGGDVVFSPDGLYLFVAHQTTPFVTIYKRPSISSDAFAKIANPTGGLPAGHGNGIHMSPDGLYLSVAHYTTPYVTIYKRPSTSSDAFAKIANPTGGLPTSRATGAQFSPNGLTLAISHDSPPFVTLYTRPTVSSDAFTKIINSEGFPSSGAYGAYRVTFSPNGAYLASAFSVSPSVYIFKQPYADNLVDLGSDPQCGSWYDDTESTVEACSDGIDNDADANTDYPDDTGCVSAQDTSE